MIDVYRAAERLMAMDDAAWSRHANPWSVWTRVLTPLPLLALAIWSRVWLGWGALVAVALVLIWIWLNPRVFAAPTGLDSWASRGVLGERVWLHRRTKVAAHHRPVAGALTAVSALGAVPFAWGLWALDAWAVVSGVTLIVLAKMWFVDRMVWVWQDYTAAGGTLADLGTARSGP